MTTRAKVERLAASRGITIRRESPAMSGDPIGELLPPDGKSFRDGVSDYGLHGLLFPTWDDALDDLLMYTLVDCPEDCTCSEY